MSKRKKILFLIFLLILLFALLMSIKPIRKVLLNSFPLTTVLDIYNKSRPYLHVTNNQSCIEKLKSSTLIYTEIADQSTSLGCSLDHVVSVKASSSLFSSPYMLTCSMVLALQKFEHEVLQPLALHYFNTKVVEIEHLGSYACRPMRGYKNLLSEHAFANALDISSFRLANGRRITVEDDWNEQKSERSKFLHALADASCELFSVVLTPDFDHNHANHFHFDQGLFSKCH